MLIIYRGRIAPSAFSLRDKLPISFDEMESGEFNADALGEVIAEISELLKVHGLLWDVGNMNVRPFSLSTKINGKKEPILVHVMGEFNNVKQAVLDIEKYNLDPSESLEPINFGIYSSKKNKTAHEFGVDLNHRVFICTSEAFLRFLSEAIYLHPSSLPETNADFKIGDPVWVYMQHQDLNLEGVVAEIPADDYTLKVSLGKRKKDVRLNQVIRRRKTL